MSPIDRVLIESVPKTAGSQTPKPPDLSITTADSRYR